MDKEVRLFLTPALKEATGEELKQIGVAAFGSKLGYVESERKDILDLFKSKLGIKEGQTDRKKLHYIIDYVESYDRNENEVVKIGEGLSLKKSIPGRRLSVEEIINGLENIH